MPRVLLIDDEESFAEALEYQLRREGYEVGRAIDGAVGLDKFKTQGADLILLDLMLPGMSGEDVCKEVRKLSSVPIIMLTAKDAELHKVLGLGLGADDYVTKPFSTQELLARMKAVLRRSNMDEGEGVLEAGGIRVDPERAEVTVRGEAVHLPRKEFELLEILMENAGRVLTRDTLIDRVWGEGYFGDSRTLDVHIKRLREKCEVEPHNPRHLITVRGLGYKFVP
ncbi:MAG TPA: response regulator transcription factor [Actinomycetota bacterium]|nr:response regulator transcription factor [Actinomycetota bacterium]